VVGYTAKFCRNITLPESQDIFSETEAFDETHRCVETRDEPRYLESG